MDTGPRPILAASAPRVTRFPLAASSRPAPSPVDPRRKRRPKTPPENTARKHQPENTARKHQPENTSPKRQRGRTASEDRPPVGPLGVDDGGGRAYGARRRPSLALGLMSRRFPLTGCSAPNTSPKRQRRLECATSPRETGARHERRTPWAVSETHEPGRTSRRCQIHWGSF